MAAERDRTGEVSLELAFGRHCQRGNYGRPDSATTPGARTQLDTPSVSQLSHVISQAAAPAFLLGALAAFIAVLISRLNRIIDRTVILNGIPDDDPVRSRLKADLPRLMRRAAMMNRAIFWAVIGSILVTVLVIVAFASAFFQIQHEYGVGLLFMVALGAFTISLFDFAREVRIALSEFDHHG
jgi:hypothetical protein